MSNESTELVTINTQSQVQVADQGGRGVDFGSKLFQLKPATINIVQPNSTAEGAIKGHLRIGETGDQYKTMEVTLLRMPVEQRAWYVGEEGQMNRKPENLMCFSRDLIQPDKSAKMPQSLRCNTCAKQDWGPYRKEKEAGRIPPKSLIPPCDSYYYALFIDTVYKMPLQMYIRSKSKDPFERGCKEVARTIKRMQAQGLNPNIFDVKFTMGTKLITTGSFKSYVIDIIGSSVKAISDEERESFGGVYEEYVSRNTRNDEADLQAEAEAQIAQASDDVNKVLEPEYVSSDTGEITV